MPHKILLAISSILFVITGCSTTEKVKPAPVTHPVIQQETISPSSQPQETGLPAIEPKADQVLKQMTDLLASAHAFTFNALTIKEQVLPSGQKLQYDSNIQVKMQRPNALYANVTSGAKKKTLWYHDTTFALLDRKNHFYATTQTPNNIDDTLDFIIDHYGVTLPLADFVIADPYSDATEYTISGFYVAEVEVNGIKTHHLAFHQENIDWQIWIDAEGRPVPRKFVVIYNTKTNAPQFIAFFKDWNFTPNFKSDEFIFQPPKGTVKIDFQSNINR